MVARGDLDEGCPEFLPESLCLGHQDPADATLANPRVDHKGQDADERVVVLEARHHVEGDEAEDLARRFGDDDGGNGDANRSSRATMSLVPAGYPSSVNRAAIRSASLVVAVRRPMPRSSITAESYPRGWVTVRTR